MTNGSTVSLELGRAKGERHTKAASDAAKANPLEVLYGPIRDELVQVEEILQRELRSDYPFVDELVRHAGRLSGKRLRTALLLLTGKATGQIKDEHLLLSAVMEMIHTATLIHDDVLDEADLRRHRETVNARWNNEVSVLLGDYLFSHSFYLASTLESTFAAQCIGRSTNVVCRGEMLQVSNRNNYDLSEEQYFEIIDAKTAELTACCCLLGACYGGADEALRLKLEKYGRDLGIAFQIADDLLDVFGDEDATGKSLGTDLEKAKPTLPLIRLLSKADAVARAELDAILELAADERRQALLDRLRESDALAYAQDQAKKFAQRAGEAVADLPESDAQRTLLALPEFVVSRRQ